jgi:hypothetical protein
MIRSGVPRYPDGPIYGGIKGPKFSHPHEGAVPIRDSKGYPLRPRIHGMPGVEGICRDIVRGKYRQEGDYSRPYRLPRFRYKQF